MRHIIIFLFLCKGLLSQSDSIPFRVLESGNSHVKKYDPILITSDKEYFDWYYSLHGVFPQNFKWDFEKEYIIVIYQTLSSGSYGIAVDAILESYKGISIVTHVSKSYFATADISNKFIMVAIRKTDKPIINW
jgi:hypothetical protein